MTTPTEEILKKYDRILPSNPRYKEITYVLELHLGTFEIETYNLWRVKNISNHKKFTEYMKSANPSKVKKIPL